MLPSPPFLNRNLNSQQNQQTYGSSKPRPNPVTSPSYQVWIDLSRIHLKNEERKPRAWFIKNSDTNSYRKTRLKPNPFNFIGIIWENDREKHGAFKIRSENETPPEIFRPSLTNYVLQLYKSFSEWPIIRNFIDRARSFLPRRTSIALRFWALHRLRNSPHWFERNGRRATHSKRPRSSPHFR